MFVTDRFCRAFGRGLIFDFVLNLEEQHQAQDERGRKRQDDRQMAELAEGAAEERQQQKRRQRAGRDEHQQ